MADDILTTPEIDSILQCYEITKLEDIGKRRWFSKNANIVKLYQIASLEASLECTERVKESVLRTGTTNYFIKDLITLSVWKEYVLPELTKLKPVPKHCLPTYIVLYNEVALIGILQSLLYHIEVFVYTDEILTDLIDYCVNKLTTLNPDSVPIISEIKLDETALEEIERYHNQIKFTVSANCITVLRYICENLSQLPMNVASRIYATHDVPILIAQLLDIGVWSKRAQDGKLFKFCENKWKEWFVKDPPLSKIEVQTWLLIRQLLLNPSCDTLYYFSQYRKEHLSKLLRHLHENVIDQLSPLADLKYWLHTNSLKADDDGPRVHNPLIVDVSCQYKDVVFAEYNGRWKDIALARAKLLFYGDQKDMQFLATGFSSCMDNIEKLTDTLQSCMNCHAKANKRCSKCKQASYCSRNCQVEHWPAHKNVCK
uniref:Putative zinc finger protein n=1 Tax=Rhodnius prolixus TaxID=13249 RepID=R4G8A8_RHOPR